MVTNSASLGRYDDVKLQMPMLVARADKAWGRLVDDTLYRGNVDVGAVTDRRAPLWWSASAKRLVHGERHARICDGIRRHMAL
jgi:hypothetical protein